MTTREIAAAFKELYDADVSPALVSKVTDAVMEQVTEWQNRPLDAVYPIVYLDCIVLKVRQDSRVTKSVFLALVSTSKARKNCWACGWPKRRREVLAQCADRAEESRPERYPHRLCRWSERLPGRDQYGVSGSPHPAVHRAYGA
ncbi:transposase [Edwardsiella ictaluri]|uniref:transposase n=1 Tax=Edwardsiella ictaluri TaxID=67780 RepID=UPI0022AC55DE|nr:transposase [Edwardsiella ictaluri]